MKDIEYTWQLWGHELIKAQCKLPLTIRMLRWTVTKAAVASACYPSLPNVATLIGVGTGEGGGVIFYPRDIINIHTCSTDRRDQGVYYVRPPKNCLCLCLYLATPSREVQPWEPE